MLMRMEMNTEWSVYSSTQVDHCSLTTELTICEDSRWCYLNRVNHTDVIENCNSVAVTLCIVNESSETKMKIEIPD